MACDMGDEAKMWLEVAPPMLPGPLRLPAHLPCQSLHRHSASLPPPRDTTSDSLPSRKRSGWLLGVCSLRCRLSSSPEVTDRVSRSDFSNLLERIRPIVRERLLIVTIGSVWGSDARTGGRSVAVATYRTKLSSSMIPGIVLKSMTPFAPQVGWAVLPAVVFCFSCASSGLVCLPIISHCVTYFST